MRFRIFGVPVVVTAAFWLTALCIGVLMSSEVGGGPAIVATIGIVFVAVLVHELGHALTSRAFGAQPVIVLHGLGGVTSSRGLRMNRVQTILMTLAGPGAGFLLGGLCLIARGSAFDGPLARDLLARAEYCTFGWGMLNLLPVLPLDGGVVLREVLGPRFARAAYFLSAAFGLAIFVLSLNPGGVLSSIGLGRMLMLTVLAGFWTVDSARRAWSYGDERAAEEAARGAAQSQCEAAARALERGDAAAATTAAEDAFRLSQDPAGRDDARRLLAAAALERGNHADALRTLASIEGPVEGDDVLRAQALDVAGQRTDAFLLLEQRAAGNPEGPAFGALVRGLLATGGLDRAATLASANDRGADVDALASVADALVADARDSEALGLFRALFERTSVPRFALEAIRAAARVGELDAAFAVLERAAPNAAPALAPLLADDDFVRLRVDPRFGSWYERLRPPS